MASGEQEARVRVERVGDLGERVDRHAPLPPSFEHGVHGSVRRTNRALQVPNGQTQRFAHDADASGDVLREDRFLRLERVTGRVQDKLLRRHRPGIFVIVTCQHQLFA